MQALSCKWKEGGNLFYFIFLHSLLFLDKNQDFLTGSVRCLYILTLFWKKKINALLDGEETSRSMYQWNVDFDGELPDIFPEVNHIPTG